MTLPQGEQRSARLSSATSLLVRVGVRDAIDVQLRRGQGGDRTSPVRARHAQDQSELFLAARKWPRDTRTVLALQSLAGNVAVTDLLAGWRSSSSALPLQRACSCSGGIGPCPCSSRSSGKEEAADAHGLKVQRDGPDKGAPRKNVVLRLSHDDVSQVAANAVAPGATVIPIHSLEDIKTELAKFGQPIGTLYIFSHSNAAGEIEFETLSGTIRWATPHEIAGAAKGALAKDKAPLVVDFQGCKVGETPEAMAKMKTGFGAGAARASNCWTFDLAVGPVYLDGVAITQESQINKGNRRKFEHGLNQLIHDMKRVQNCIRGLGTGERATKSMDKIGKIYFANGGVLVAGWASPEYNKQWQKGSKCLKDLPSGTGKGCRIITA